MKTAKKKGGKKPVVKKKISKEKNTSSSSEKSANPVIIEPQPKKTSKRNKKAVDPPIEKPKPAAKAQKQAKNKKVKEAVKRKNSKDHSDEKEEDPYAKENENKTSGHYVFFKNPKYMKIAQNLLKCSPDQVKSEAASENFTLAEKIHTGNLLTQLSSKFVGEGENNGVYGFVPHKKAEYEQNYEKLMETYTVNKLKEILVLNEQPKSANKNVLCERVADGMTLGRIPKCPTCLGGRMKFNRKTGVYFCPGFIDGGYFYTDLGDDYIFCNKIYNFNEITRETWKTS